MERRAWARTAGAVLIIIGIAALGLAILNGEAEIALLVIVPVIYGTGALGALAILSIFVGMLLLLLSFVPEASEEEQEDGTKAKKGFGGVVLIGPVPIVFGSARTMRGMWVLAAMAALCLTALMLLLLILLR